MHLSMDKFVMADFDLESGIELEVSKVIDYLFTDWIILFVRMQSKRSTASGSLVESPSSGTKLLSEKCPS